MMDVYPALTTGLAYLTISLSRLFGLAFPVMPTLILLRSSTLPINISASGCSYRCSNSQTLFRTILLTEKCRVVFGHFYKSSTCLAFNFNIFNRIKPGTSFRACILNTTLKCCHLFSALLTLPRHLLSWFPFCFMWLRLASAILRSALSRTKGWMTVCPCLKFFVTPFARKHTFLCRHMYPKIGDPFGLAVLLSRQHQISPQGSWKTKTADWYRCLDNQEYILLSRVCQ